MYACVYMYTARFLLRLNSFQYHCILGLFNLNHS